jgi:hypothetical protein
VTAGEGTGGALRGRRRQQFAATLADRYLAGETSILQLARDVGRRPSLVRRLLEEAGIDVTIPSAELTGLYRGGQSIAALACGTELDRRAVRRLLTEAGVTFPPRATAPERVCTAWPSPQVIPSTRSVLPSSIGGWRCDQVDRGPRWARN